jgi:hypothetical protein
MTLFPLLPPMMTVAVCGGLMPRLFDSIDAGRAGVDQRSGCSAGKQSLSPPVADGPRPAGPDGAAYPAGSMNRAADSWSISAVGFWKRAAEG